MKYYRGYRLKSEADGCVKIKRFYEDGSDIIASNTQDAKENIDRILKDKAEKFESNKMNCFGIPCTNPIELAPLQTAVPQPCRKKTGPFPFAPIELDWNGDCVKQEGKTPMRYNDNYATASASVQAQPSDTAVTRDYLLGRLAKADYPKDAELRKFFNLHVDNTPKTYKDMIAIIQAGTYTIDPKIAKRVDSAVEDADDMDCDFGPSYYGGPLFGIIWPGPVADYKGFEAAGKEKSKQYTAAKDTIMVSDAAAGLAAIQAFEAWMPAATAVAS